MQEKIRRQVANFTIQEPFTVEINDGGTILDITCADPATLMIDIREPVAGPKQKRKYLALELGSEMNVTMNHYISFVRAAKIGNKPIFIFELRQMN